MGAFGIDVDYAQLVNTTALRLSGWPGAKYSPGECCTASPSAASWDKPIKALVSTSYVEKHNQTMRQHMKRFARLTAASFQEDRKPRPYGRALHDLV